MPQYSYDRLSAQDASFLWAEQPNQPMHVGALALFESEPLQLEDGGIDIERYRAAVEGVLHWIPRYRQKLAWVPIEGWPVWVDDDRFDLRYHIRHIALPRPGRADQLAELAARINARPLDRRRPLWEIWVIEGLEDGTQFAVVNKIHHCMIDGAAGADLSQILMSPSARAETHDPVPYRPRPAPTDSELLRDAVGESVRRPLSLLTKAARRGLATRTPESAKRSGPSLEERLSALGGLLSFALNPASETPINGELGPHRRLEWLTMPLDDVRELKEVLGCTINDVVLATVAGAMRRYLFRRRVDHRKIEFRVAAPVSTRREEHDRRQGNHVSSWIVPLPLDTDDPLDRLDRLRATTRELKDSGSALAVETLMEVAEFLPASLISQGVGMAQGPANMIVTNVPGPQFPLYMVGAKLLGMYPLVPLLPGGGLGVALFSYEGKLCWGFNGDYELIPDLGDFKRDVHSAFEELRNASVTRFLERRTDLAEEPERPPRKKAGPAAERSKRKGGSAKPKPARKPDARTQSAA